ncbi:unnamed protein product [Xyrichtys novacula]|uniref:Unnamed protein product n=1 Tax=Xyrichtys novacula TaxID=13765 RepID=A0AAV1HIC6_XYRNO|nr:unnamed protein product [Xyrichtys novacula]
MQMVVQHVPGMEGVTQWEGKRSINRASCGSGGPDGRHEGPGLHWSLALESTGAPTSTGHIPQDVCP